MGLGPISVRDRAENARYISNDVPCFRVTYEGPVAAVMLDNKNPDQEKGIDNTQCECEPVAVIIRQVHKDPQSQERQEGGQYLNGSFFSGSLRVLVESPELAILYLDILH